MHGIRPLDERKICRFCFQDTDTVTLTKLYTRKELVVMETYIDDLHNFFYISAIKKLVFQLPHICIIGTNHCGNTCRKAFKCNSVNKYVL